MDSITLTPEQLTDNFLTEIPMEEMERIYNTWQENISIEHITELVTDACKSLKAEVAANEDSAAAYSRWSRLDKIMWCAKECYISGVMRGIVTVAHSNRAAIDEIISKKAVRE